MNYPPRKMAPLRGGSRLGPGVDEAALKQWLRAELQNEFGLIRQDRIAGPSPGGPPTGDAGGDLDGTYPDPVLGSAVVWDVNLATVARELFVQLASAADVRLSFGSTDFDFGGGGGVSVVTVSNIAHNLGKTPEEVVVGVPMTNVARLTFQTFNYDSDTFDALLATTNVVNHTGTRTAGWIAVG